MCIWIASSVLWSITLMWIPDDNPKGIDTCRSDQHDIVIYCIYSIRSNFWMLVTTVLLLLSWTCLAICLRSPSSFAYSYVPHCRSVCPSALVHSCPISTSDWEPLSRCPSCWFSSYFSMRHSASPYNTQYSPFHLPQTSLEHLRFLLRDWPCLGAV